MVYRLPIYSMAHIMLKVRIWPKLEMHEISEVKEMPSYGPPEVLVQREKRRAKYLWQLIQAKQCEIPKIFVFCIVYTTREDG